MLAQFEHLDETYFAGFDYDLGERELDLVSTVDHELDTFAAALGLTRTSIAAITKDDGLLESLSHLHRTYALYISQMLC
jgi:dynactin 1